MGAQLHHAASQPLNLIICNSCCLDTQAPQPMVTSDEQSVICRWWAAAQKAFMTSVFSLEAAYRCSLKLSCAPNLCWFMGVPPLCPRRFRHPKRVRCRAELKASSINSVSQRCRVHFSYKTFRKPFFQTAPAYIAHVQRVSLFRNFKANTPVSVFLFSLLTARSGPNKVTSDVWHCALLCEVAAGGIPRKNLQLGTSGTVQTGQVLRRKHGPRVMVNVNFERYQVRRPGFVCHVS